MAIATSDSYKSFSTQEVKEYFEDQSTYYDLLDQIHGFFWVDDTTVDSSDTVQIKGKNFIRETGTGNDDMDNSEFYSPDGKQRLKFRKADELNATRWLDDVIEREKDDPDLTLEDIPEFTLNNFKWHGVRLKGQEISEQYVIIGEDLSTPDRWIYLYGMGTTCDSDLSVDVIGNTARRLCANCAVSFFVRLHRFSEGILPYFKEKMCNMTEKMQVSCVQSLQAFFVRCCL
ncbi:hypothetical protein [Ruminococcus sp. NK3A76]|uniref:hypothetical protein n=1 Tax=Ruminococcus sp. NK3A76 TaxID=877411 RepID=UPI00048AD93B|nr:hypothetical protein [Ruminococcus sp. NK3A76]